MTTKVLDKESVFFAIAEQTLGYQFGKPERVSEESLAVVLPILRHTTTPRAYTTFPETEDLKVTDSGRIDVMQARNTFNENVFLRSGTIFKGATQERASVHSMIILAGKEVGVPVRCIHQTRGIRMGAQAKYAGNVPLMYEQYSYAEGFKTLDQSTTWSAARTVNACMSEFRSTGSMRDTSGFRERLRRPLVVRSAKGTLQQIGRRGGLRGSMAPQASNFTMSSFSEDSELVGSGFPTMGGSDDLASELADFSKSFDQVLSKVKLVDDQVGLVLLTERGCETLEVFDAHQSWKALHEDAVKRLGPNMAQKDKASVFEYKPEKAVEVAREVLALPWKENLIHEHKGKGEEPNFRVLGLTAEGYTGEVVELNGQVIHLLLLKLAKAA